MKDTPSQAGYSGTPLPKKLGIKPGSVVWLVNAPVGFDVGGESPSAGEPCDVIVAFFERKDALLDAFRELRDRLRDSGGLWIAWPKKASKRPTDLVEDTIRDIGLAAGLVDNKVCAIDDTWSGLRLVVRVRDRR